MLDLQSVYDEKSLNSHIKKYSNVKGLIVRYLHDIEGAILNKHIQKCITPYQKIKDLLIYLNLEIEKKMSYWQGLKLLITSA